VTETKRCKGCEEEKPLSEFYTDKTTSDGYRGKCKVCFAKYAKEQREKFPEKISEQQARHYRANKAQILEWQREHYRKNRDQILEAGRQYRAENPEKRKESVHRYYASHKEEKREQVRAWVSENSDRVRRTRRRYHRCVTTPTCPNVGRLGAEFVLFTCEACGAEFRRLKSEVDYNYERKACLPRFCSRSCANKAQRKDYKSPYARNIERIKKAVGA